MANHHYNSSERMHRLAVAYALLGLLFGCLSAGLIVASFGPRFRPAAGPAVVVFPRKEEETSWASTSMDHFSSKQQQQQQYTLPVFTNDVETPVLRGNRRLKEATNSIVSMSTNEPTTAPFTASLESPSAAPTELTLDDAESPTTTEQVSSSSSNNTAAATTETIAATMVGVASSIIVCALFLYASDVRDRYRNEQWAKEHDPALDDDNSTQKSARQSRGESQTSAGTSAHAEDNSGPWVKVTNAMSNELVEYEGPQPSTIVLPPLLKNTAHSAAATTEANRNFLALIARIRDDASISRVSTLTASLVESGNGGGGYSYYVDIEEKLSRHALENSAHITELDDCHRVSDDMALSSLIQGAIHDDDGVDASVCSSLTNGSQSTARLYGEECLDFKMHHTPGANPLASLEVSPDTPYFTDDDDDEDSSADGSWSTARGSQRPTTFLKKQGTNVLAQLEHLIAGIPHDEMTVGTPVAEGRNDVDTRRGEEPEAEKSEKRDVFVRDICFVPSADGKVSLGLELYDAASSEAHPTVANVDLAGPLVGRLFVGDSILSVNAKATTGLSSEETTELFEAVQDFASVANGNDAQSEQVAKMVKLTVMSSESDGGSLSDGQLSVDFGEPDSVVEV